MAPISRTAKRKLTPQVRRILVEGIRVGLSKAVAAGRAGIGDSTLHLWLSTGRTHRDQGYKPAPFNENTQKYEQARGTKTSMELDLLDAMEKAQHDRLAEALMLVRSAAHGGAVTERTTTTVLDGTGQPMTTVKEKVAQPAWQAAAWIAERTRQEDYALRRTEITGANGGPVQVNTLADLVRREGELEEEETGGSK